MKILLVSDFISPQMHGISVRCGEWIKELRNLGHEVRVLSSPNNDISDFSCDMAPLPFNPDVDVVLPNFNTFREILSYSPDVIHSVSPSWPEVYPWVNLFSRMTNTPVVTSHHVNIAEYGKKYWDGNPLMEKMFHNLGLDSYANDPLIFSEIICGPTKSSLQLFKESPYYDESKMKVFSTGINRENFSIDKVDSSQLKEVKEEICGNLSIKNPKVVLYAGRIAKEKGLDIFFELAKRNLDTGFVICGIGPEEELYRKFCQENNLKNVYFAGKKDQKTLSLFYHAADLMISPSTTETFGFTIIECMAMGTPVLIPKVDVFEELHKDFPECLVSHDGDFEKIVSNYSENLDCLLYNNQIEVKRLLEHCASFTWKNSAIDMASFYESAIDSYKDEPFKKIKSISNFILKVPLSKTLMPLSTFFFRKYLNG